MEKNTLDIFSNGLNVKLSFRPNPPIAIKIVLLAFCALVIVVPWFLIVQAPEREQGLIFLGSIPYYIFMYFIMGKYTLWNVFGAEHLTISTKAINYQHNFGIFNTAWKALSFDEIYVAFTKTHEIRNTNYGQLAFITANKNGVEEILYITSIIESEEKICEAITEIEKLFIEEKLSPFGVIHQN
jgi:hypothetical protein